MLGWLALIVAALTGLFVIFQSHAGTADPIFTALTAVAVVAVLIGLYVASLKARSGDGNKLKWIIAGGAMLLAAAVAGWFAVDHAALPDGFARSPWNVLPSKSAIPGPVSVLIRRNNDGNFIADGQINGMQASLLFDTGASVVMLKPTDAERAGIDLKNLTFTVPVQTANGTVYAAPVRIRSIAVGLLKVEDVEALVAKPGSLNENLLGMNFLRRLASYSLAGDFLTLRE